MRRPTVIETESNTRSKGELTLPQEIGLYVLFGIFSVVVFVLIAYATTPFDPYEIAGYSSVPSVACPNQAVTIEVRDSLRQPRNVELRDNAIIIWSQFVGTDGIASFSELSYPVHVGPDEEWNAISEGGHTRFARQAPSLAGDYLLRSRVEVTGYVFGRFRRVVHYPVANDQRVLTVLSDSALRCEVK